MEVIQMLSKLNKEQEVAVNDDGNVLLIACPGSGKTHTLVNKVAKELSNIETHRKFIVAITYTNNAAEEMKIRIKKMGINIDQLWVGTIHSFCLEWILRPYSMYAESLSGKFEIIDEKKQELIIGKFMPKNFSRQYLNDVKKFIGDYRIHEIAEDFLSGGNFENLDMEKYLEKYREYLNINNMVDFQGILEYSLEILSYNNFISENLSNMFPLIAIDEYQDTNILQYLILSKIAKVGKTRLFVVGDPNQGIYTNVGNVIFRKSDLERLMEGEFAEYALINNYRSSSKIVEYSQKYMVESMGMIAVGELCGYNSEIRYLNYCKENIDNFFEKIKDIIEYNINILNIDPSEICILAPWWNHLAPLAQWLGNNLPNISVDGVGASAFWGVKNSLWYKITKLAFTEPSIELYRKRLFWAHEFLDHIAQDYGYVNELIAPIDILDISNEIRFNLTEKWGEDCRAESYLRDFFGQIMEYMEVSPPISKMVNNSIELFFEGFTDKVNAMKDTDLGSFDIGSFKACKRVFNPGRGIKISTIHGVKGEEYDTVILFAALEDFIPHYKTPVDEMESIAKKLLYVTASRARKNLWIIAEPRPDRYGYKKPCRYIQNP